MKKVIAYEYRSNNVSQHTVAKLECGHERVFEYGYYPPSARCWECEKPEKINLSVEGEFTCVCGNDPNGSGAFACDRNGKEVEPTPDNWPDDLYCCGGCGRIFNGHTGEVIDRKDNHGKRIQPVDR